MIINAYYEHSRENVEWNHSLFDFALSGSVQSHARSKRLQHSGQQNVGITAPIIAVILPFS